MTQTRGRPTQALQCSGGAIRHVAEDDIAAALKAAGYAFEDAAVVSSLHDLFRDRIAAVDAPPASMRDDREEVKRIQRAARELSKALSRYPNAPDMLLQVADGIRRPGQPWPEPNEFFRWLVGIERSEALFHVVKPANEYRSTIRRAHDAIKEAGHDVRPYSEFLAFLNALDDLFPGLVWPPLIDPNSTKARTRRIEEALKD